MIPRTAVAKMGVTQNDGIRIWVPLFLLWLLFVPLALLLSPLLCAAGLLLRINLRNALSVFWNMLCGLKGTSVVFEKRNTSILIQIS
jgi:hypothetical protein